MNLRHHYRYTDILVRHVVLYSIVAYVLVNVTNTRERNTVCDLGFVKGMWM